MTDKRETEGWFPLSHNSSLRTQVKFTLVNKIETMYGRPRVNVKVEWGSTFTFTRDLPYIVSTLFTRVNKVYVRNAYKYYATVETHLESDSMDPSTVFSTFKMDKFGKLRWHHWRGRLEMSEIVKFKSDTS